MINSSETLKFFFDYYKETKEAAKERLKLPIVPFYVTLVILNYWKAISVYLFSGESIEGKITYINILYNKWTFWDHLQNLSLLMAFSFVMSTLFPVLMWGIDFIIQVPNNRRKNLQNSSKIIDWHHDLASTQHKYDKEKILSGNKEIEEYNESIDSIKKSYDDRIKTIENVNNQKEENLKEEVHNFKNQYEMLSLQIKELNNVNEALANDYASARNALQKKELDFTSALYIFDLIRSNPDLAISTIRSNVAFRRYNNETKSFLIGLISNDHFFLYCRLVTAYTNSTPVSFNRHNEYENNELNFFMESHLGTIIDNFEGTELYDISLADKLIKNSIQILETFTKDRNLLQPFINPNSLNRVGNPGDSYLM